MMLSSCRKMLRTMKAQSVMIGMLNPQIHPRPIPSPLGGLPSPFSNYVRKLISHNPSKTPPSSNIFKYQAPIFGNACWMLQFIKRHGAYYGHGL